MSPICIVSPDHILGRHARIRTLCEQQTMSLWRRWDSLQPLDRHTSKHQASPHLWCTCGSSPQWQPTNQNGSIMMVVSSDLEKLNVTLRHCKMDKFHYATPAAQHPEGAQQILCKTLPHHVPPIDKPQDTMEKTPLQHDLIKDTTPTICPALHECPHADDGHHHSPVTAAAAQLLSEAQQNEIIHLIPSPGSYGTPITIKIPIKRLPILGINLQEDAQGLPYVYVTGCQERTQINRMSR